MFYAIQRTQFRGCATIGLVAVLVVFFLVPALFKWVFALSLLLLLAALLINWRSLPRAIRGAWRLIRIKPWVGLSVLAIALVFFPITAFAIFTYAIGLRYYSEVPGPLDGFFNLHAPPVYADDEPQEADFEEVQSRPASKLRIDEKREREDI